MILFSMDDRSIRNISAADFAYQQIKKQIIVGELAPESPIVEEHLAKDLSISRTPLREALQRLEIEDLVLRKRNGRLKVAPITIQEVEEIFTIRSLLEGIVVKEAAKNSKKEDIKQLKRTMKWFKEAISSGDFEEIIYFGGQFHAHIYEMSGNKTAVKLLYQLNDHILRYRRFVPKEITEQHNSLKEHKKILTFLEQRNPKKAQEAMKKHIMNSLLIIKNSLQEQTKDDRYDS